MNIFSIRASYVCRHDHNLALKNTQFHAPNKNVNKCSKQIGRQRRSKLIIIPTKFSPFYFVSIISAKFFLNHIEKEKNERKYNFYNEPHKQELIIQSLYYQNFVLKEPKKKKHPFGTREKRFHKPHFGLSQ